MPDILDDVECDQRLMLRLGLRMFSGRLLDLLLSYRYLLVGGIDASGLLGLGFRWAFRGSVGRAALEAGCFLAVGAGDEVELDREVRLL
jgi:hypothetical protein